ncbi:MAG: aminomethyl-transferring glycine dehydrogenase subunit GcvPB, partial [Candidatus Lokiarchaeota archaeon]
MNRRDNKSKVIFEKQFNQANLNFIPKMDIEEQNLDEILPKELQRTDLNIPNIPEVEIIRHYTNLSQKNYCTDIGIYPLGSCTMKYNPKINEKIATLPGFSKIHPLQEDNKGGLKIIAELSNWLKEITGMHSFTLFPAAGAHGELTGMMIIKKYFEEKGLKK